jgi:elongation factor 1-alpha
MKVGDQIIIMPSGNKGEVRSIETHHTMIPEAGPGDNIGFSVKGISRSDARRGDVIGLVSDPPSVVKEFIGQIIVIHHPTAIATGYTPVLHSHTVTMACTFTELIQKIDPRTGQVVEEKPDYLKTGDGALVKFRPLRPIVIETYTDFPPLGRFAIRDMGSTVAAGVVREITEKA